MCHAISHWSADALSSLAPVPPSADLTLSPAASPRPMRTTPSPPATPSPPHPLPGRASPAASPPPIAFASPYTYYPAYLSAAGRPPSGGGGAGGSRVGSGEGRSASPESMDAVPGGPPPQPPPSGLLGSPTSRSRGTPDVKGCGGEGERFSVVRWREGGEGRAMYGIAPGDGRKWEIRRPRRVSQWRLTVRPSDHGVRIKMSQRSPRRLPRLLCGPADQAVHQFPSPDVGSEELPLHTA